MIGCGKSAVVHYNSDRCCSTKQCGQTIYELASEFLKLRFSEKATKNLPLIFDIMSKCDFFKFRFLNLIILQLTSDALKSVPNSVMF